MADLIDREKVIEAIDDISVEVDEGYGFQYEKWRKYFCELSSADLSDYCDKLWKLAYERGKAEAQPRKGKWIRTRTMTHDGELYCDQCEQEHPEQKIIWNFCPSCGCRMEEGDAE